MNPSHKNPTHKLKIAKGQIDGVLKMIDEGRYCIDIVEQISASISLLERSKKEIMETHIRHCVREAFVQGDEEEINKKIAEVFHCLDKINN